MLDEQGAPLDFTGCGNTVNANHPPAQDLIVDALRYWVAEMHVDGFRFDLGAALTRGRDGEALDDAPLLERIAADPLLAGTKLIAEPWDAAGLYRLGSFGVREGTPRRWSEWNDRFRDDLRRFVRGDDGSLAAFATRLAGSSDLFRAHGGAPRHTVNYAACHDGLSLADLTAYSERRNVPNGEGNRDGHREPLSWNCGVEGPTDDAEVLELRRRQMKNLLALTFVAQGVPLLQAGDELGNAWCQDNATNWIDWSRASRDADLLRFARLLIAFRKRHPGLRRREFFADGEDPAVRWHGRRPHDPDWSTGSRLLGMQLVGGAKVPDVHLIANTGAKPVACELPEPSGGGGWYAFVDTGLPPGEEIVDPIDARPLRQPRRYLAAPRSVVILVES
jgi:glycogen operon protein